MKTVLLVDDEESTRIFVRFALKRFIFPVDLRHLYDGFQAVRYLKGEGLYSDFYTHPFPDLMLLDLRMPIIDGFDVLEWSRAQPGFRNLPIVVLTESSYEAHVTRALQLGATSYVTKVVDLFEFEQALKGVFERLLVDSPPPSKGSTYLVQAA